MVETVYENIKYLLIFINPQLLPRVLLKHLNLYENQLRNIKKIELRKNFGNRFNHNS